MQFTSKEFQEFLSVRGSCLTLAAPEPQETNVQVKLTRKTLRTISQSIILNAQVLKKYIHFALIYTTHHIFTVLPIKHLVNQYCEPTKPQKLATGTKPSVSNIRVLFFTGVVQK